MSPIQGASPARADDPRKRGNSPFGSRIAIRYHLQGLRLVLALAGEPSWGSWWVCGLVLESVVGLPGELAGFRTCLWELGRFCLIGAWPVSFCLESGYWWVRNVGTH